MQGTRKVRNVVGGRTDVALVVDDLVSFEPFVARGIRVYGVAAPPVERVGMIGPGRCAHHADGVVELEHGGRVGRRRVVPVASRRPRR